MKALIDTGAGVTIMHEDLFARIKTKETRVIQSTKTIVGASNTPLGISGIAEVEISVHQFITTFWSAMI